MGTKKIRRAMAKRKTREWKHKRLAESRNAKREARLRKLSRRSQAPITDFNFDEQSALIRAPKKFALEHPWHDPLVNFLAELRQAFTCGKQIVRLDFRAVENMVAGGSLLFFCEFNRLVEMYPEVVVRCIASKDNVVNQVLTHLGIYKLCGYDCAVVPNRPDVINWKFASSDMVDGPMVGKLIEQSLDGAQAKQAFRGASEAMINSVNHAYEEPRRDGLPEPQSKKWWMFCRQDSVEDKLFIAVCDLGIGIPRSLPLKHTIEVVNAALSYLSAGRRRTDSRMIQAAMEISRTRTDKEGRGLGLHNLKRLIDDFGQGALYIFSNAGLVKYQANTTKRVHYKSSILGTVVVWSIPLGATDGKHSNN